MRTTTWQDPNEPIERVRFAVYKRHELAWPGGHLVCYVGLDMTELDVLEALLNGYKVLETGRS